MGKWRQARVSLVLAGGTCLMGRDEQGHLVLLESVEERVKEILPSLEHWAHIEVEEFSNLPGEWLSPSVWVQLHGRLTELLASPVVEGVVVVLGTDGLEETAYFLHLTVPTRKPLVFTASLRGLGEPGSDAPLNLVDAVRVAATPWVGGKGVLVVMNGKIYSAREVRKNDAQAVAPFSGELGPLGLVDREGIFFYREPLRHHTHSSEFARTSLPPLPRVDICCAYAGADGALIEAALAAGAEGIVVAALGSGNVSRELGEALVDTASKGIPVVVSSQAGNGRVSPIYKYPGGGGDLAAAGCVFADNLSPLKARVLLMVALQHYSHKGELTRVFSEY